VVTRPPTDPGYLEARRVLLDALAALGPQLEAVVLVGAQAIYLRVGPNSLPVADHTTDGDLALDPKLLVDEPTLEALMRKGGFQLALLQGAPEPGIWVAPAEIDGVEAEVAVDLIVPSGNAPPGGNRGARLPSHGKRAARKASGLEAALVDNDPMTIAALDPDDRREAPIRVAGVAALLVAKTHKIADRIDSGRTDRLSDKDAADVLRLMQATDVAVMAAKLVELAAHPRAGETTGIAIGRFDELFGTRNGAGVEMATRTLRLAMPEERVRGLSLAYAAALKEGIAE